MSLTRSKAVLELGKRLVAQLEDKGDLLASWMAHYVASKIECAEMAPPESQAVAADACAKAILDLWHHQNVLPQHLRPFAELEPVSRALVSLDVDHADYRYFPEVLRAAATADAEGDVKRLLEFAIGLDYTARLLIQSALRCAAQGAALNAEPWLELARQAGEEEGVEKLVINFILPEDGEDGPRALFKEEALRTRLARVENFASLAASHAGELRAKLSSETAETDMLACRSDDVGG